MYRSLSRAIFQGHVVVGLLASGWFTHRLLFKPKASTESKCTYEAWLAKRMEPFVPVDPTVQQTYKYRAGVLAMTTLVTTGAMAALGATWILSYPFMFYASQTDLDLAKTIGKGFPYTR